MSLVQCLSEIHNSTKFAKIRFKANAFIHNLKKFQFDIYLNCIKTNFDPNRIVSTKLQLPDLDHIGAVLIVEALKNSLTDLRNDKYNYSESYKRAFVAKFCNEL